MTREKAEPDVAGRTACLVLGMHRSGTSAVAQALALAGADLPRNLMPGDAHNERGYFEPWKIAQFNDLRLRAVGSAWDDALVYPYRELTRRDERTWLNRAGVLFDDEYGPAARPLLKDPRVTVLLPFWREALRDLEVGIECVIAVRNPLAVARSLTRRDGFTMEKSLLIWCGYMLAAEAYSRGLPRVFVDYDRLLADWRREFSRITATLRPASPPPKAAAAKAIGRFLSTDLRHNTAEESFASYGWAGEMARTVHAWYAAAVIDEAVSAEPLDSAASDLERWRRDVGALISPVARDLDAARAELLELRQSEAFHRQQAKDCADQIERLRLQSFEAMHAVDAILARA